MDDPWQLDMSELCLSEGFSRNMQDNGAGQFKRDHFIRLLMLLLFYVFHPQTFGLLFLKNIYCMTNSLLTEVGCSGPYETKILSYLTKRKLKYSIGYSLAILCSCSL